jgi:hypothetical protein
MIGQNRGWEVEHMLAPADSAGRVQAAYERIAAVLILVVGCGSPTYFRLGGNGRGGQTGGLAGSGGETPTGINTGSGGAAGRRGTLDIMGAGGDGTAGSMGTGGITCAAGQGGQGGQGADVANAQYQFETTVQSWKAGVGSQVFTSVVLDTAHHFSGQSSLAGSLSTTAPGIYILEVDPAIPTIPPGTTVTFHVYVPDGAAIAWIQPYVQDAAFVFSGIYADVACLTRDGWSTLALTVPSGGTQVGRMGVQFYVTPAWTGTVYVDSVSW